MSSLYELTQDLVALDKLLEETGGDVSEGSGGATLEQWLKTYEWQLGEKIDAYGRLAKNWEADVVAIKEEAGRLAARAAVVSNKIRRLKEMAKFAMETRGVRKLEGTMFTIAIQKNGGKPPMVMIVEDIAKIPDKFVKRTPSVDGEALRAALEAKDPDAEKVARIDKPGESVRIR